MFKFLPVILILLLSCDQKQRQDEKILVGTAKFDDQISRKEVNPDTLAVADTGEINSKGQRPAVFPDSSLQTSTVDYCRVFEEDFSCSQDYRCDAYIDNSDTLVIHIGRGNGYIGNGIVIGYKDGNYNMKPFTWTHNDIDDKPVPVVVIKKQSLVLDKKNYNKGDSLFGKIYLNAEMTEYGEKTGHFAQGYFRCKIDSSSRH